MYALIKRLFEIILTFIGIVLLLPLFIVISILIKLTSRGPAIFKQKRMGRKMKPYTLYKFRTMVIDAPNVATNDLEDAKAYVTKVGRFLRKTSLDELPQLFNVLIGQMSLIGPRPVILEEIELIEKRNQAQVYRLKPGLTGWAQVNGRDNVTIDEKVAYDKFYLEHKGFILDMKIFFKTIYKVLFFKDVTEGKQEDTKETTVTQ